MRRLTLCLIAALTLLPPRAGAQQVTFSEDTRGTRADIAIDWPTLQEALDKGVTGPLMSDRCGTTATATKTALIPPGTGEGAVAVILALSRWQCIRVSEMVCKGFACRPVVREQRTQLFSDELELRFALTPDIAPGARLTISAAPALDLQTQQTLLARVPDFRRIDFALRNRISAALAPAAEEIQKRLPTADALQNLQVLDGAAELAPDGLKFQIIQPPASE